jgi:GNAT superfamily N-acetyltransferase
LQGDYKVIGARTHEGASLSLEVPLSVPAHLRGAVREVHNLKSEEQRKGHASALMRKVCAEADRAGKVLMLMVNQEQNEGLVKFYNRFGFKATKDGYETPIVMVRAPEKPLVVAHG